MNEPMNIDIITIFPEYMEPLRTALLGKAIDKGLLGVEVHNLRSWTHDVHQSVDDTPYGGGPGMVMLPEVWAEALEATACPEKKPLIIIPTPAGTPFSQQMAKEWSQRSQLIFACGRYEGIDQRVVDWSVDHYDVEEVSIGDYVLIGGEVATMVMIEALARFIPGVLGNALSAQDDSFSHGLLEAPSYTKPRSWRGYDVPEVLFSGNHRKIESWRRQQSLMRTARVRPDLLEGMELSAQDRIATEGTRRCYRFGPINPEDRAVAVKKLHRFDPKTTIDLQLWCDGEYFIIEAHTTKPQAQFEGLIEARLGSLRL